VGFDNEYVMMHHLGKGEEEIKQLYECGALGKWADVQKRRPPSDWDGKRGLIMCKDLSRQKTKSSSSMPREEKESGTTEREKLIRAEWMKERDDPRMAQDKPEVLDDICSGPQL
jgi:hypothetical protein